MEEILNERKKITLHSEVCYLLAILIIAFAVAMATAADFGISMIVAPAYILSQKVDFLTFGQAEYIIQGILIIVFCIIVKKVKLVYFTSFITGIIYGAVLDLIRLLIPIFNESITPVGSFAVWLRILFFLSGMTLTSFSIALFFKVYLYPQVYDFFVKGISEHFNISINKFKRFFDLGCFAVSLAMTLILFGGFVGVNWGTIVITICNSFIIKFFSWLLDKFFVFKPIFPKFATYFDLKK